MKDLVFFSRVFQEQADRRTRLAAVYAAELELTDSERAEFFVELSKKMGFEPELEPVPAPTNGKSNGAVGRKHKTAKQLPSTREQILAALRGNVELDVRQLRAVVSGYTPVKNHAFGVMVAHMKRQGVLVSRPGPNNRTLYRLPNGKGRHG